MVLVMGKLLDLIEGCKKLKDSKLQVSIDCSKLNEDMLKLEMENKNAKSEYVNMAAFDKELKNETQRNAFVEDKIKNDSYYCENVESINNLKNTLKSKQFEIEGILNDIDYHEKLIGYYMKCGE